MITVEVENRSGSEVPRGVVGGSEISQATAGARNIYMAVFRVPAGAQSRPHYHEGCESAVYMLSGSLRVKWGDHLEQDVEHEIFRAGENVLPAGKRLERQSIRHLDKISLLILRARIMRWQPSPNPN